MDEVKQRALTLLGEAGSFDRVNSVFLRLITPIMSSLTRADVERIIRMPNETQADLIGARGYDKFILKVREANIIPAEELNLLLQENEADYLVPAPAREPEPEPEPENQDI